VIRIFLSLFTFLITVLLCLSRSQSDILISISLTLFTFASQHAHLLRLFASPKPSTLLPPNCPPFPRPNNPWKNSPQELRDWGFNFGAGYRHDISRSSHRLHTTKSHFLFNTPSYFVSPAAHRPLALRRSIPCLRPRLCPNHSAHQLLALPPTCQISRCHVLI
jgi:hypothetical protein